MRDTIWLQAAEQHEHAMAYNRASLKSMEAIEQLGAALDEALALATTHAERLNAMGASITAYQFAVAAQREIIDRGYESEANSEKNIALLRQTIKLLEDICKAHGISLPEKREVTAVH